jgi:hypothetical protein
VGGAHARAARGGRTQPGPLLRKQPLRALRRGFSNTNLLAAIGLLALVTFLLQVQSGDINPLAWFAPKPAATTPKGKAATGKKAKAPPMIVFPADPLREAGERYVKQRKTDVEEAESTKRDLWLSVARMDSDAAAAMLAAMDQTAAVQLLSNLEERELARIFEAARPAQAAQWAAALQNQPQLPAVPDAFKEQAKQAGLYDDTAELLQKYAAGANGAAGAAASGAANPGAAAGAASGVTAPPGPGAPGAASTAPPAPGASVLPGAFHDSPAPVNGPDALTEQANSQNIKPPSGGKRAKARAKTPPKKQRRYPPGASNV